MPTRGWLFLVLPGLLQAQAALGKLYYTTPAGRAVAFKVVDAGPGRMTLAPETGDAARVRAHVLAHAGDQGRVAFGARILADPVPPAWQGGTGAMHLIQTSEALFWCHAPGQVLPARFTFGGQTWALLTAELPPNKSFQR